MSINFYFNFLLLYYEFKKFLENLIHNNFKYVYSYRTLAYQNIIFLHHIFLE